MGVGFFRVRPGDPEPEAETEPEGEPTRLRTRALLWSAVLHRLERGVLPPPLPPPELPRHELQERVLGLLAPAVSLQARGRPWR